MSMFCYLGLAYITLRARPCQLSKRTPAAHFLPLLLFLRAFILTRPIDDEPSRRAFKLSLWCCSLLYFSCRFRSPSLTTLRPVIAHRSVPCRCRLPLTPRRCLKAARYRLAPLAIPSLCIFQHLPSPLLACSGSRLLVLKNYFGTHR